MVLTDEHRPSGADRASTDLLLARLHLRTGLLTIARSELETLDGRFELDDGALSDLAEARWRTGDLVAAGTAAATAMDRGVESPLVLMIAAEAAHAGGRPGEARRLATRAMTAAGGSLDALFAGMPRSSVWPPDPAEPAPSDATLFGDDGDAPPADERNGSSRAGAAQAAAAATAMAAAPDDPDGPGATGTAGLWDEEATGTPVVPIPVGPSTHLEAGLSALRDGDPRRAATLLGLAVRTGPHLAPAIVDGTAEATDPALLLVRGDALRAVGHEVEAQAAYAAAAAALVDDPAVEEGPALQSGPTDPPPQ